jgi:hypothetical protein
MRFWMVSNELLVLGNKKITEATNHFSLSARQGAVVKS